MNRAGAVFAVTSEWFRASTQAPQALDHIDCVSSGRGWGCRLAYFSGAERVGRRRGARAYEMGCDEERKYSLEDSHSRARAF